MKILSAALSLVLFSTFANAGTVKLVNQDGSELSQLCIAATQADGRVYDIARSMGLNDISVDELRCNGRPVHLFVSQFRAEAQTAVVYQISPKNAAPETLLCRAAVTSAEEFTRLKEAHFSNVAVDTEVACNGMPLKRFVRRYQGLVATAG